MWGNKKPETPQGADPEPKNVQTNQPRKSAPESWEGTTKLAVHVDFRPQIHRVRVFAEDSPFLWPRRSSHMRICLP
jgi:hypothetical protein